jgi:hypothetical protein
MYLPDLTDLLSRSYELERASGLDAEGERER